MDATPQRLRPWAHLGIFIGISVFLSIVELALEWRAHQRGFDTLLFSTRVSTTTSSHPFRSAAVSLPKPDNTLRLWFASASHGEDSYLPVELIFPAQTCTQLQKTPLHCDVLNGSQAGVGIGQNLALFERHAKTYQPDIVVLYQGSIEIQALSAAAFAPAPVKTSENETSSWMSSFSTPARELLERTTLFAQLTSQLRTRLMAAKVLQHDLPPSAYQELRDTLRTFVSATRAQDSQPMLATFAARYTLEQQAEFSDELFRSQLRYNPYLSRRAWLLSIEKLNQIIRETGLELNVPVIEIASNVSGHPEYFRDFSHFTPEGHQAAAKIIADTILQQSNAAAKAVQP